jgi:ABC-type branched-subunit amino acid transport system ATPase component
MRIIEGKGVCKNFGGLAAVSNVDFHVNAGEILGLIGSQWRRENYAI